MSVDKIRPFNDPRVTLRSAILNGYTYGYLHSKPPQGVPQRGTIVLVHGFPDISFGWRYQIPFLTSLGLEVIAIDCLGYGRSDSPPTHTISAYTYKRVAADIATLCEQLGIKQIHLGGHDWGGAIVYRVAQYQPTLVKSIFVLCTPYQAPRPVYVPLHQLVATILPNFAYQLHFISGEIEQAVQSPTEIRQFLSALYGGRTTDGTHQTAWRAEGEVALDLLPLIGKNKLLNDEEMEYYTTEYARHGINGPLNWYRSREAMFLDDLDLFFSGLKTKANETPRTGKAEIKQETLFIFATKDTALPKWMSDNMAERIPKLSRGQVDTGHWALWEKPAEVNAMIGKWLEEKVFGKSRL